jgi:SanA protein
MAIYVCLLPAALAIIAVAAINVVVARAARGRIVARVEDAPDAPVAIVMGAMVFADGSMADMTRDRVQTAVALYQQGKAGKLLFSGDHGRRAYDEVNAMRRAALAAGVPPEDIFLDHAGFSTYETMYRARQVFGVTRALVVTQNFHLPRAIYLARKMGIDAIGVTADLSRYRHAWRQGLREYAASCKAFWQVLVGAQPRFLGPPIPIAGDGRVTWDQKDHKNGAGP